MPSADPILDTPAMRLDAATASKDALVVAVGDLQAAVRSLVERIEQLPSALILGMRKEPRAEYGQPPPPTKEERLADARRAQLDDDLHNMNG